MSGKAKWDLTSLRSLESAAEWIRKDADAVFVLVVRGEDVAFAVDPRVRNVQDAADVVDLVMPGAIARAEEKRAAEKEKRELKGKVKEAFRG